MINRARLSEALLEKYKEKGLGESDITAIMNKYFYFSEDEGLSTYFGRPSEEMEDIVKFVVKNGGTLILPHPTEITKTSDDGSRVTDYGKIVELLKKYARIDVAGKEYLGFRGVEVYSYKIFKNQQTEEITQLNKLLQNLNTYDPTYSQYPLIVTAGSDGHFHFDDFASKRIPAIQPENDILEDLIKQLKLTADIADGKINI
jgi:hypothetical protein